MMRPLYIPRLALLVSPRAWWAMRLDSLSSKVLFSPSRRCVFPSQPGNGAFSFEAWFQTSQGSGGVILGQQDSAAYGTPQNGWSPAIYVGTDGNLYVEMFYSGTVNQTVSPVPVNDNQWHHVAVTYDGNTGNRLSRRSEHRPIRFLHAGG